MINGGMPAGRFEAGRSRCIDGIPPPTALIVLGSVLTVRYAKARGLLVWRSTLTTGSLGNKVPTFVHKEGSDVTTQIITARQEPASPTTVRDAKTC